MAIRSGVTNLSGLIVFELTDQFQDLQGFTPLNHCVV